MEKFSIGSIVGFFRGLSRSSEKLSSEISKGHIGMDEAVVEEIAVDFKVTPDYTVTALLPKSYRDRANAAAGLSVDGTKVLRRGSDERSFSEKVESEPAGAKRK